MTRASRWFALGAVLVAAPLALVAFQATAPPAPPAAETVENLRARSVAALARIDGELGVEGLAEPVEVIRDRWGVPHIYAKTLDDLFFAQGFVAAQDRLWQLDLWRRVAMGEMAEVFGPGFVDPRHLRQAAALPRRHGRRMARLLAGRPADRRGVRTRASTRTSPASRRRRPVAHRVPVDGQPPRAVDARGRVEPHGGLHHDARRQKRSAARANSRRGWACLASPSSCRPIRRSRSPCREGLDLADITDEVLRIAEGAGDGWDAVFTAGRQADAPTPWPAWLPAAPGGAGPEGRARAGSLTSIDDLRRDIDSVGSNNWVVSGARSVTGRPLLANDPHRSLQLPSLRYTVHLNGAGLERDRGRRAGDARHRRRPQRARRLRVHDRGHRPAGRLRRAARPEGRPPCGIPRCVRADARRARLDRGQGRGAPRRRPALHPARAGAARGRGPAARVRLRWVGTEPGTAGYLASLSLNTARSWDEFRAAAARWAVPSENLVYADVGRQHRLGRRRVSRPCARGWNGLLPVPGHDGQVRVDRVPAARRAAARVQPAERRHRDGEPQHPAARLLEGARLRLDPRRSVSSASPRRWPRARSGTSPASRRLQHDELSVAGARHRRRVARGGGDRAGRGRRSRVRGEDADRRGTGRWRANSAPAALYGLWLPHLQRAFAAVAYRPQDRPARARRVCRSTRSSGATAAAIAGRPRDRSSGPHSTPPSARPGSAWARRPAEWAWGRVHRGEFEHPLATTDARRSVLNLPDGTSHAAVTPRRSTTRAPDRASCTAPRSER